MASRHRFLSTLAKAAFLGTIGVFAYKLQQNDKQAKLIADTAKHIAKRATDRVKKVGAISKDAYEKMIDSLIHEYKGIKNLSSSELKQLKAELHDSWKDVVTIIKKKPSGKKKRP